MIPSTEVDNSMIQDRSKPMVLVGSDVVGLYPCMRGKEVGQACYDSIRETEIKWSGINYKEGTRYLAVNRSEVWCRTSKLRRVG